MWQGLRIDVCSNRYLLVELISAIRKIVDRVRFIIAPYYLFSAWYVVMDILQICTLFLKYVILDRKPIEENVLYNTGER